MGSTRDFLRSAMVDAALPTLKQALTDVLMETMNEQQLPSRTDYQELRDLVNTLRGQVNASQNQVKKLSERVAELEARLAERAK